MARRGTDEAISGQWIGLDGQTAKEVDDNPGSPKPLELTVWENSDGSASHTVSYTFVDAADGLKELRRDLNDVPGIMVAEYIYYIDPDDHEPPRSTSGSWDEVERVLTVTIAARMGDKTETRTFEIKPRPDEPEEEA